MLSTILTLLGPIIVFIVKQFIGEQERLEKFIKSYYGFIDQVDHSVKTKVANHIALNEARMLKQLELLKAKKLRDEAKAKAKALKDAQ